MSTVTQWRFILALLIASSCRVVESKVFERCELAKVLRQRHRLDLTEVAQWVCIAQHSSGFNTAAQAFSPTGGSHGLFQISDVYWCSPPGQGAGCNLQCHKLRDDNLSDDLSCVKRIYDEHHRISGDGYTAWNAYQQFCKNKAASYIQDCFPGEHAASTYSAPAKGYSSHHGQFSGNAIQDYSPKKSAKVYGRCELARELHQKHKMPMQQIPTWVCIAEHESRFNTAAVGRLNADGSADHGLFQISDLYWCSHDRYSGGKACGLSCNKLLDNDITDDVRCVKRIHNEHTAIAGDGFTAWTVYKPHCQNQRYEHVASCFKNTQQTTHHKVQTTAVGLASNQVHTTTKFALNSNNPFFKNVGQQTPSKTHYTPPSYNDIFKTATSTSSSANKGVSHKGKVYTRCSLAQELFSKHNFPMQDIATWVCIAEHESHFNTAAIGRLNTDGSADHGLFQISDLYWCDHNAYGGKACNLPCDKLLDDDLRDDVACIKTIHEEHSRISGDGFNAWTVYKPHCQNQNINQVKSCFDAKTLESIEVMQPSPSYKVPVATGKGKIYSKCELAKELYHKHRMPMEQIPKWVCIAQHESSFNTGAVGRLNTDGSADHGLFQISDLYWCSHDQYGGKACNIPCHKLLDSDITDDVRCVKIIHEEHTRISGDGFNAWTVYQPHCRNTGMSHIKECFTDTELTQVQTTGSSNSLIPQTSYGSKPAPKGKIYKKCELAQELFHKHRMPMDQIPKWVCIAQHESSYNTAAVGRLNTDGSADHGLFQVSDLYWCSHDQYGGKACNIPCDKLLDSDIADDVRCIKMIHEEHTRISGDGFNAWTVYKPHCRNTGMSHIKECFTDKELTQVQATGSSNSLIPQTSSGSKPVAKGKIYKKCELAQELFHKHRMPMEQIPKWVCIAQHESSYNTAAVGRLNTDGSADHGLFQVSDLYWCSHDQYGGKACNIPCDKLLDSDIADDVRCIKMIHEEHTRISGDGFNAWTVYKPHCRNTGMSHIKECFTDKELTQVQAIGSSNSLIPQTSYGSKPAPKGKIYKKCELAQELFHKHRMPMDQIPKWVCIAQHESSYNTAAVGRLNTDGSADHGLFQVSDLYWCSHDQYGGKACNIPCDKLLDSDIADDVRCIKMIHEEHTRISGDGFNAWTVYKPHCRNTGMSHIKECFTDKELTQVQTTSTSNSLIPQTTSGSNPVAKGKIYKKCELAQELYHKHRMPMEQIPKWVCIAQHESSYNTAAVGRLNTDGSADHGLFQVSDLYWCSHDQYGGKACNIPCDKLLDSDIADDVRCIKMIHEEHTRISGDGFNAWTVYKPHCRNTGMSHIKECFTDKELTQVQATGSSNSLIPQTSSGSKPVAKGKIYKKCELAQELFHKHRMPMEQIPKWVCIAQHESSYNTGAVGRLNTDGSADHGLFQISDLYWCTHDQYGGKACNIPCAKFLDSDITDDVRCIQIIHEEHTRISGDGFNAWTVYKPHCRNTGMSHIKECFTEKELKQVNVPTTSVITNSIEPLYTPHTKNTPKGKIYKKCELAQELLSKHKMPMEQIPTWVCIAQHESSYNTAAVGRLNADGSFDHGLFQISDLYWCSHDQYGGKACNIPCDKLLDSDITDDVRCIKIIHEEHTRISGDGFNAWTVYKPHCRNRKMEEIRSCFTPNQIEDFDKKQTYSNKPKQTQPLQQAPAKTSAFSSNPFLSGGFKTQASNQVSTVKPNNEKPNYANNPFLQNLKIPSVSEHHKSVGSNSFTNNNQLNYQQNSVQINQPLAVTSSKPNYKDNPFLNGGYSTLSGNNFISKPVEIITELESFKTNPFLSSSLKLSTTVKPTQSSLQNNGYHNEVTKNYLNSNDFRTTTTTFKPKTTATKPTTTTWTTTKKPTTSWNSFSSTRKPITTTTRKNTTNKTTTTTKRPTTTGKKPTTTTKTTKSPKTTTTWSWQNQKSTTTKPKTTSTTKSPRTTTTWHWQNQKYTNNATLGQVITTKSPRTTTTKPEKTTWNWRNEQKSTTLKPLTSTANWQKWDKPTTKGTTKKPSATTTTTQKTTNKWWSTTAKPTTARTTKPIRLDNQKTTTSRPTTAKTTRVTTTKPIRYDNYKTTTLKPQTSKTTTLRPRTATTKSTLQKTTITTTTRKPFTTKSTTNTEYNKYKNDPFSHPFFAKVNEQLKQLRGNVTTTKLPSFAATKLQSFPQSTLYQDFKNSTFNKTKTIVAYNFEGSKLSTTKRPRF
ncbi:uncharacterized protein LOC135953142 [Calliphora vicina]|uniref:uncharacterized protein LOC135953142 n=1 Tax=Calliphora vicina TaxID=7373 RepID=UPI00325BC5ED